MKKFFMLLLLATQSVLAQTNPDLPDAALLTKEYLEEISKREVGQKNFAVKDLYFGRPMASSARGESAGAGGERAIQEADVFKLGKKGKKELFLLNRYRGFQVVSFAEGLEKPKLIGRFPVYNNWNSEMYYLEKEDKVLVVNTEWSYSTNRWATNYNTNLYLIDVSVSAEPKIVKELNLPGYLYESRMVGDVLYTITNTGAGRENKALVTSIKLTGSTLESVDEAELHTANKWVTTMNVLKEGEKYYVISTLSNWNDEGDLVSVHDITSDKGQIEKVLTVKARGRVLERSQTFLHKNHLFAVSNYRASRTERARVSVEAFPLKASTAIVESAENMRLSVGDTAGLDASLQDVRVSGDLLYAFWVPSNNIDPFDLFDISAPEKGLKHLGQLQFDGWISKAFPIEHNDKKYVLGLGWVTPTTSETGKRYPQAKLFEIKKFNNTYKHEEVATLTISSEDFWASMNVEDKYFEVLQEKPGVYNTLFPVTFSKHWKSGAKIISADLNTTLLKEGSSVVGDQGWLNRVFVNREVRAINTFSDLSLESFDLADIDNGGLAKTVSILELARNIVDFHVFDDATGFQLVKHEKSVELRQVALANADAEKAEISGSVSVKGTYQWHAYAGKKLHLITSVNKVIPPTETQNRVQERFDHASFHVIDLSTGKVVSQVMNLPKVAADQYYYFDLSSVKTDKKQLLTVGTQFFSVENDELHELTVDEKCKYFFAKDKGEFSLTALGNEIFAHNSFSVPSASYSMPFMKKLLIDGKSLSCSASVNVPGKAVLTQNNFLVTTDSTTGRYFPYHINYEYVSLGGYRGFPGYHRSNKTFSLKFNSETQVEIVDILNKDITAGLFEDGFITYAAEEKRLDLWSLSSAGDLVSKPQYLESSSRLSSSLIAVRKMQGRSLIFMKNDKKVDLYELSATRRLKKLDLTSSFDLNKEDGSAEFVFDITGLEASKDLSKIYVSQGYFGVTELIVK